MGFAPRGGGTVLMLIRALEKKDSAMIRFFLHKEHLLGKDFETT